MRIRRPRGITVQQLMVVTAIGFLGGVYIWKPLFQKYREDSSHQKENSESKVPLSSDSGLPTKSVTET